MDKLKEITETVRAAVRLMVDSPNDVLFEVVPIEGGASIQIIVTPTDAGKLIGKQGANARALRTLTAAMGMTAKLRST